MSHLKCHIFELIFFAIFVVRGDDKYTKVERPKRFFTNLNAYFSKSTESTVEVSKVNVSRILKPVYVFDNEYLCGIGSSECKSHQLQPDGRKFESSTPVTYLTPPPSKVSDPLPKFGDSSSTFNGYFYPSQDHDRKNQFQGPGFNSESFRVSVFDVLCVKSSRNGQFTIGLTTSRSMATAPVIENSYQVENAPQCSVATINSTAFQISLHEPDVIRCGVYYCNSDTENNLMCINLRFPLIAGLKTSDDVSVRIQCHPQQQLLSHVKQLQLKSSHLNSNIGRSLPLISTISSNNVNQQLHTDVNLYALTSAGYTHLIRNNDVVTLGEELQLRGVVRQGDGWQYSRFGRIIVQRVLDPSAGYAYSENNDAVVVVAEDGCVNSAMKMICPNTPFNDPVNSLVSMLNMKMFIFNNMKDGDELTMSITMFGCVHYEDCFIDNSCQSWSRENRVKRSSRREINNTVDSTSEITIKIKTTPSERKIMKCDEHECKEIIHKETSSMKVYIVLFCCLGGILFAIVYHYYSIRSIVR